MSVEHSQSPFHKLATLAIEEEFQENKLNVIRKIIIKVHEIDDKVERETAMVPIRAECVNIHNARIAIAVARQKALKRIADIETWKRTDLDLQTYKREFQNVWTA